MTAHFPIAFPGQRIGLFGGSFNPPHGGHVHASTLALKRLKLDRVWWLVSPQNPLKPVAGTAPLKARLEAVRSLARDPRIVVTDIEARLRTRFTADTVAALQRRYPGVRFVLVLGADNLLQLPHWERWTEIFMRVPVAVVARPGYGYKALSGRAAHRFAAVRLPEAHAASLPTHKPPGWIFLMGRLDPTSSTGLRTGAP